MCNLLIFFGAPSAIRTRGTQIRNLALYPPELWGHFGTLAGENF